jgi:tyrosyl-tRNA synthetase
MMMSCATISIRNVTCYIGFDPTASSLHVGSLVPIMSLAHMQRNGHRPIALVGGGTGLVGDPSGKTEMRKLLTEEDVEVNVVGLKNQLSRFIDFSDDMAIMVNNADWLTRLEYIPFPKRHRPAFFRQSYDQGGKLQDASGF